MPTKPITDIYLQFEGGYYRIPWDGKCAISIAQGAMTGSVTKGDNTVAIASTTPPPSTGTGTGGGTTTQPPGTGGGTTVPAQPAGSKVATVPSGTPYDKIRAALQNSTSVNLQSGNPNDPSTWPKIELNVGGAGDIPTICDAMAAVQDIAYMDSGPGHPLDVTLNLDPAQDYVEATSGHYMGDKTGRMPWPPFEQVLANGHMLVRSKQAGGKKAVLSSPNGASLYYGKGILVPTPRFTGTNITFEDLHFKGARRGDVDGRLNSIWIEPPMPGETGVEATVTFRRCITENADTGILNGGPLHTLVIEDHWVKDCGSGSGYTHNIYIGRVKKLIVRRLLSTGVWEGHLLKVRAAESDMEDVRLLDDPAGPSRLDYDGQVKPMRQSSYALDFPNGGKHAIRKLRTLKGPNCANGPHIAFGEEGDGNGGQWPGASLTIDDWVGATVLNRQNQFTTDYAVGIWDQTGGLKAVTNASIYGVKPEQFGNRAGTLSAIPSIAPLTTMPTFDWTPPA